MATTNTAGSHPSGAKERVDRRHETDSKYSCTQHVVSCLKNRVRELEHLPEPSEEWLYRDTDLPDTLKHGILECEGIIKKVDEIQIGRYSYNIYTTRENAYEALQDIREERKNGDWLLPCCAESWINNEVGVDGITCGACGVVHDRDKLSTT